MGTNTLHRCNAFSWNRSILLALMVIALSLGIKGQATYYWIGGQGEWSDITHWATTSGGSINHTTPPTALDNVIFDQNSISNGDSIFVYFQAANCANLTMNTAKEGILYSTKSVNIYGSLQWEPSMQNNFAGGLYFSSTNTGNIINMNSVEISGTVYFDGIGGEWTLASSFYVFFQIYLNAGTFKTNNYGVRAMHFYSTVNAPRTLNLGNSTFNLNMISPVGGYTWAIEYSNSFTLITAGNSHLTFTSGGLQRVKAGDGLSYDNITFSGKGVLLSNYSNYKNVVFGEYKTAFPLNNYVGKVGESPVLSNNNTFINVTFKDQGFISGRQNLVTNTLTFMCNGNLINGSNLVNTLSQYRYSPYNGGTTANSLTLQADSLQSITNFSLFGSILCDHTIIKSSTTSTSHEAMLFTPQPLTIEYVNLNYIHATNSLDPSGIGIAPDTAKNSLTTGAINWVFPDNYHVPTIDSIHATNVSPCNQSANGTLIIYASGGMQGSSLEYSLTGTASYSWQASPIFNNLAIGTYNALIREKRGAAPTETICFTSSAAPISIVGPSLVGISSISSTNASCNNSCDGTITINASGGTPPYTYCINWNPYTQTGTFQASPLFTGLCPGTFNNFMVRDSQGCSYTGPQQTLTILNPLPLTISSQTTTNTTCFNSNDGTIQLTANGGTVPYSFTLSPTNQTNGTGLFENLQAGTYTVQLSDANSCQLNSPSYLISSPDSIVIESVINQDVSCYNFNDGSILVTAIGGTGTLTYNLSPSLQTNTDGIFTNLAPDTYTVMVTDESSCQVNTDIIPILNPAALEFSQLTTTAVTCTNFNNGTILAFAQGGTGSITYNLQPVNVSNQSGSFINISPGTYQVVASDINGCQIISSDLVVTEPAPISILTTQDSVSCNGLNNGCAYIQATGGTPPYNYQWQTPSIIESDTLCGLSAGNYQILVTDVNSCLQTAYVEVLQPAPLSITFNTGGFANPTPPPTYVYYAQAVVSGGTPPFTHHWESGETSDMIYGVPEGVYTDTIIDANGCIFIDSVYLQALGCNIPAYQDVKCYGESSGWALAEGLGGNTPYQYAWRKQGEAQVIGIESYIANLAPGSYDVTVTDANLVSSVCSVNITEPEVLELNLAIVPPTCPGGIGLITSAVTGGYPFISPPHLYSYNYLWNTLDTTPNIIALANSYSLIVIDSLGCITSSSITLTQPDTIKIIQLNSTNISCYNANDGTITLVAIGGSGTLTYTLLPDNISNQTGSFQNLLAGTYSVIISDENDCNQLSQPITITNPNTISISSLQSGDLDCHDANNGFIHVSASGGTLPLSYTLVPTGTINTSGIFNSLAPDTYVVQITDVNNCPLVQTSLITIQNPDTLQLVSQAITPISCHDQNDGSINVVATGGTGLLTYTLQPIGTQNTTGIFNALAPGTYSIMVTDSKTCQMPVGPYIFNNPDQLEITTINFTHPLCDESYDGTISIDAIGGTAPLYYSIDNGISFSTNPIFSPLPEGLYTIITKDSHECLAFYASNPLELVAPAPLALSLITSNPTCNACSNGSITCIAAGGSAPYEHHWNTGQNTASINNLVAGILYSDTVKDAHGCVSIISTSLSQPAEFTVTFDSVVVSCFGGNNGSIIAHAHGGTAPYQYSWVKSGSSQPLGNDSTLNNLTSGTYLVEIMDSFGYTLIDSVALPEPLPISTSFTQSDLAICPETSDAWIKAHTSGGNGGYTYVWASGTVNPLVPDSIFGLNAGTYPLQVTDSKGCISNFVAQIDTLLSPIANFLAANECQNTSTWFQDLSVANSSGINQWRWSYGDGQTLTVNQPQAPNHHHLYNLPGQYIASLIVVNSNGCVSDTSFHTTIVYPNPQADFSNNTVCFEDATQFIDQTDAPNALITNWNWNFGDGFSSTQNPLHTFTTHGLHTTTLVVTDLLGCIDSITKTVRVDTLPEPNFSFADSCTGTTLWFNDLSQTFAPEPTLWNWNFGDGYNANIQNPFHTFGNALSNYTVTLTITNSNGCQNAISQLLTTGNPINGDFSYTTPCLGTATQFTATANLDPTEILDVVWNFGDGAMGFGITTSHTYVASGSYQVSMTITTTSGCIQTKTHIVYILPNPVAIFSFEEDCMGEVTSFTDLSYSITGIPNTWAWNFGDGSTSNQQNPTHLFSLAGEYTVSLQVTDNNGCTAQSSELVSAYPLPTAGFEFTNACQSTPTVFSDTSNGNGSLVNQWDWNFGDLGSGANNSSTLQNPTHTYPTGGIYLATLLITTNHGCTSQISKQIAVNQPPVSSFTVTQTCFGDTTWFVDLSMPSVSPILSWQWDFGDGGSSNLQNPSHKYAVGGQYTVTLAVTDANGCIDTHNGLAVVHALPTALFQFNEACEGQMAYFTDYSNGAGSTINTWNWNFGDLTSGAANYSTLQNPSHLYQIQGTYQVTLQVTNENGCSNASTQPIQIIPSPVANFEVNTSCAGQPSFFNNLSYSTGSVITSWYWDFGDGQSSTLQYPSHNYLVAGNYTATLTVTNSNNCVATVSKPVNVLVAPTADFTFSEPNCQGDTTYFINLSSFAGGNGNASYAWNFGDGGSSSLVNPSHYYAVAGDYVVSLTITTPTNCIGSTQKIVHIGSLPIVSFTNTPTTCKTYQFTDQSYDPDTTIALWYWNFGDAGSGSANQSNAQNPVHEFSTSGTFDSELVVVNAFGCSSEYSKLIEVTLPVADFTTNNNTPCPGIPVQFTDVSNPFGANIVNWAWDFGDGTTSTQQNPTHTYSNSGSYITTLFITTNTGCVATKTKTVTIGTGPTANFTFTPETCIGFETQFTDISGTTYAAPIQNRLWDFGDGNFSTLPNPVHTYTLASTYNVSLAVTDLNGCTSTSIKPVKIFSQPIANFSYSITNCNQIQFNDLSICMDTLVTSWLWNFGDQSSGFQNVSNLKNPQHIYYQAGIYTITLISYSATGCSDTTYQTLEIIIPTVEFESSVACNGNNTLFTDQTVSNGTPITNWFWQFGDGNTSSLKNPSNLYTFAGNYSVILSVSNVQGCQASKTKVVYVLPKPTADFTFDTPCKGNATHFTDASYSAGNVSIAAWVWDFGDGNTSNLQNPIHTYEFAGNYQVSLSITDVNGCSDDTLMAVTVYGKPIANFTWNIQNCDTTYFVSTSGGGTNISTWLWNFDDAGSGIYNTSTQENPWHYFTLPGTYDVQLIVTNSYGCKDTITNNVLYDPFPQPDFIFDTACSGDTTHFIASSSQPNIIAYNWNFDDGSTGLGPNPVHVYSEPGTYFVTLIITNSDQCSNYIQKPVKVNASPVSAFTAPDTTCLGLPITFTNTSSGNTGNIGSYAWDFGDGNSSSAQNPVHTYLSSGNYTVQLVVTNSNGCESQSQKTLFINPGPIADFIADPACLGSPTLFTDLSQPQGSPLSSWHWAFGDGATLSGIQNPVHVYGSAAQYNVTLTTTDASGCSGSTTHQVIVNELPNVAFTTTASIHCNNDTVHFVNQTTGQTSQTLYTWYFGEPTSGSSDTSHLVNPTHVYDTSGTYYVTLIVEDPNGCISQTMDTVEIQALPVTNFTYTTACANDTIFFTDLSYVPGGSNIVTWAWDFGDGTTSSLQNPYHIFASTGTTSFNVTLTTTSSDGCSSSKTLPVQVFGPPVASFDAENVCFGSVTYFDNSSTTPTASFITGWAWDFGDTTYSNLQNPTHYYTYPGEFSVSLICSNSNGCSDTLIKVVHVFELPLADFISDTVCFGDSTHFTDLTMVPGGQANTWYWTFGDPLSGLQDTSTLQNPTHLYTHAGTFEVMLLVGDTNGCSTEIYMNAKVDSLPIPAFTFTPATCQNTAIHFDNTSIATDGALESWTWIFGDGSDTTIFAPANPDIAHIYTQQGIFTATLIVSDSNGCVDSVNHMFQIYPLPVAGFSFSDSACTPGLIYFNDTSYGVNASLTNWLWNFDYPGGYTSNLPDPYHFYTATDTSYTVMLSIEDIHGCRDTIFDTIFINKGFTVDFEHQSTCFGNPTLFNPMVIHSAQDSITSVSWAFGDGENSSLLNPEHIFASDGLFYTQLIATNQFGCEAMVIKPIQILQLPEPHFIAEEAGCNDSTYFVDSSIPKSGSISSWHWYFGDGTDTLINEPGLPNVAHLYQLNGQTYQAKLIVTNSNGCSDSLEQVVVRNECLTASFIPLEIACHDQEMYFKDMTSTGSESVNIVGWWWDFGDGQTAQYDTRRDSINHTYQLTGSYSVSLVITAVSGSLTQTDTATYNLIVNETPQADFVNSATCSNKPVHFTDATILEQSVLVGWKWDFGDGDTTFEQNPAHVFDDTLSYPIQLIALSNFGCTDTIVKNMKVYPLQKVQLALPSHHICSDMAQLILRDTSGSSNVNYAWDFGDGEFISNNSDTISHIYYPGNYEIVLKTIAETGCENSDSINLIVNALPYANYSFDPDSASVLDAQIRFFDLSEGNGSSINTIQWLFDDGSDTLTANPTHIFSDTGYYQVHQIVTDYNGCSDTLKQSIRIYPELTFFMPSAFTPNQDNKNNIFMPKGRYFLDKTFTFQIFSKWGELIYESTDPYEGWDGTYKGSESPVGVYIWVISLRDMFNDKELYKGTVMLVR